MNHIKNVLRMKCGDEILVLDESGMEYNCVISGIGNDSVTAKITGRLVSYTELPSKITLYQGVPKGDKMDFIVQKCVELGVSRIVPVKCRRCIVKLDGKKEESRLARWRKISESAAKQSGRSVIPQIGEFLDFDAALLDAEALDVLLIPYEKAVDIGITRKIFEGIAGGDSIGIFIGPEGGFEEAEVSAAVGHGARAVTLGRRILRTETAGVNVLSILGYLLEK